MTDKDALNICCLKYFFVGPPVVGKTTTLNRLLKIIVNIYLEGDKAKYQSTLLANCIQALALIAGNAAEWFPCKNVEEELKLIFSLLSSNARKILEVEKVVEEMEEITEQPQQPQQQSLPTEAEEATIKQNQPEQLPICLPQHHKIAENKFETILAQLKGLVKKIVYSKLVVPPESTLLNIHDIGGQPGFLEMLPALSTGPAMYLVFLDLSKELNQQYEIPFDRDGTVILPFKSLYTVESTISQILASIASIHCFSKEPPVFNFDKTRFSDKFKRFLTVKPRIALIGTHLDKLDDPEIEIKKIDKCLETIISNFGEFVVLPVQTSSAEASPMTATSFFPVNNYDGEDDVDIAPIRSFMNDVFRTHFQKNASLPIQKNCLILGMILRMVSPIIKFEYCVEIGQSILDMTEEDVKFCLWYLDCIGTLMYYTNIDDEDGWFNNHIISSPQVIFNSISQLIVASLSVLHSKGPVTKDERAKLIKMGQFSLEAIEKYALTSQISKKIEEGELIPAKQLIKLLKHANLLSPIIQGEQITYLMPAILECASPEELNTHPPPDANNPEPLHITFACGYVPTGTFCGLITRLVSLGPAGIFGLSWKLVEEGVKRNCVSFFVAQTNKVTLIAHENCYEIRVSRNHDEITLHDLCSYLLFVILYTLKSLYNQLDAQIAFQCSCPDIKNEKGINHLCVLTDDFFVQFLCEKKPISLRKDQQVWLGKVCYSLHACDTVHIE